MLKELFNPPAIPLSNKLNPWRIDEDGVVFMHDTGVELGLRYHLPEASSCTTARVEELSRTYRAIIEGCRVEGARFSFVTWHRQANAHELMEMRFPQTSDPLEAALITQERAVARERAENGEVMTHENFIFIHIPDRRSGVSRSHDRQWSDEEYRRIMAEATGERARVINALRNIDLTAYPIVGDEPFDHMWRYYNLSQQSELPPMYDAEGYVPDVPHEELLANEGIHPITLRSQICTTDNIAHFNAYIENGDKKLLVVDMTSYGEHGFAGMADAVCNRLIGMPHIHVVHVHISPEASIKNRVERNVTAGEKTARDTGRREDEARAGVLNAEVMQAYSEGGRFVRFGMSHVVVCDSDRQVREVRQALRDAWQNQYRHRLSSGTYSNWEQFTFRLGPYSGRSTDFLLDQQAQHVTWFLPYYGPWHNIGGETLALFNNAYGGQQRLTLPRGSEGAPHMAVIGSTRSGKSFTVQKFLMNLYCSQGAKLRVMDMKDDYRPLIEWLGGVFIPCFPGATFADGTPVQYNAFAPRERPLDPQDRRDITTFIKALIHEPLDHEQDAILTMAVEDYCSAGENKATGRYDGGRLSDFVNYLYNVNRIGNIGFSDDPRMRGVARGLSMVLQPYVAGDYGLLFNGEGDGTIDLHARVVAFDMSHIGGDAKLMGAVAVMLHQVVWREAKRRNKEGKRIVFVSEETGISGKITEVREMIKESILAGAAYNIMNVIIAQNYEHIEALGDVLNNISRVVMGRAKEQEAALIARLLHLNDEQEFTLANLSREDGVYNELFVREEKPDRPHEMGVIRFAPTELEFALFSTTPEDKKLRDDILRSVGGNMRLAVDQLILAHRERRGA